MWWLYVVLFAILLNGCRNYSSGSGMAPKSHCYVSAHRLNLRECAGTTCRIITVLKRGTGGIVLQEWWDWIEIDIDGKDLTGWVSARYLTMNPIELEKDKQQISHKKITAPAIPDEEFASPDHTLSTANKGLPPGSTVDASGSDITIEEEFAQ